jgi:hypothetical protein
VCPKTEDDAGVGELRYVFCAGCAPAPAVFLNQNRIVIACESAVDRAFFSFDFSVLDACCIF